MTPPRMLKGQRTLSDYLHYVPFERERKDRGAKTDGLDK